MKLQPIAAQRRGAHARFLLVSSALALCAWQAMAAKVTAGRVVSGIVALSARALDENREYETVMFFLDDECLYSTNVEPFTYDWDTRMFAEGRHLLRVEAYRGTAKVGWSRTTAVVIANDGGSPLRSEDNAIELPFSTAERTRQEFAAARAASPPTVAAARPTIQREQAPARRPARPAPIAAARAGQTKSVGSFGNARPVMLTRSLRTTPAPNPAPAAKRQPVRILLDGEELPLGEVRAEPNREIVYLRARQAFAKLGAAGTWFHETQTFFARVSDRVGDRAPEKKVWLTVGERCIRINRMPRELEAPVRMDEGALVVPVGACRQAFDLRVVWVRDLGRLELFTEQRAAPLASGTPLSFLLSFLRLVA